MDNTEPPSNQRSEAFSRFTNNTAPNALARTRSLEDAIHIPLSVWIKSIHAFTGGVACKDNTSVVDKLVELGYKDILVIEPELNQELIRELKDREFKVDALSVDDMLTDEVKSTPLRYEVILCLDVLNCLPPWFGVPLLDRLTAMDYKYLAINHCESILENRSPGLVRKSINSSDTSMSLKRQKTSRPAEYEPPFLRPDTPEAPSL